MVKYEYKIQLFEYKAWSYLYKLNALFKDKRNRSGMAI